MSTSNLVTPNQCVQTKRMVFFDTNILIGLPQEEGAFSRHFDFIPPELRYTTPINLLEFSCTLQLKSPERLKRLNLLNKWDIHLPPSEKQSIATKQSIAMFQNLFEVHKNRIRQDQNSLFDLMIASIVLSENGVLVTKNVKDFDFIEGIYFLNMDMDNLWNL